MDEEIDEWFKLEKEKLEKRFFEQVLEKVNAGEEYSVSKVQFEKKFKKLLDDYEQKYYKEWDWQKRKKILMKPVNVINRTMHEFVVAFREKQ